MNKKNGKKRLVWIVLVILLVLVSVTIHIGTTYCKPDNEMTSYDNTIASEDVANGHEHVFLETIVDATCIKGGSVTYKCDCGYSYDEATEALGHSFNISTIDPTYTTRGYDKYECTVCGHCHTDNWTDKVAHDCDYDSVVTNPTCVSDGYTTNTCKLCGDVQIVDKVSKLAHKYIHETIAPTCVKKGYDLHTCALCATSYQDNEVDMLAHKYTSKVTAPTCTSTGYTTHICACGRSYKDSETAKIAHRYIDTIKAPTCTERGYTEHVCSGCGTSYNDSFVDKVAHVFGAYVSDNNATCEKDGTKTAKCNGCGLTNTVSDNGSVLGHAMNAWMSTNNSEHTRTCTRNGCSHSETAPHEYTSTVVVNPTCTNQGYTQEMCVCGHGGKKTDYTDALGHAYETKTVAPTYTEQGYDLKICARCGDSTKSNYVDKIPHDCTYNTKVTAATCTDKGYTTYTCKLCSAQYIDNYVDALDHDYKEKIVAPTCTDKGYTTHTCSRCKDAYTDSEVAEVGHSYTTSSVQATTGWGGYDYHRCTVCGHSYKDNVTDKLPANSWPKGYSDSTCTIIVYKEWHVNAYVYAAHVTFSDYSRLWMECANGKYNSGGETTSHAAKRVGAILAINGDYAVPYNGASGYAIARKGIVYNDKPAYPEGVYNSATGRLTFGHSGRMISELVAEGLVTDTFQFGPCVLIDGKIVANDPNSNYRAQSTFIGTNGNPGDIWLCVADGRYNDGKSVGLNPYEIATYMQSKGCTLCVPLDGGGSSTMYFNGQVLNAASGGQRAVVDFLMFK